MSQGNSRNVAAGTRGMAGVGFSRVRGKVAGSTKELEFHLLSALSLLLRRLSFLWLVEQTTNSKSKSENNEDKCNDRNYCYKKTGKSHFSFPVQLAMDFRSWNTSSCMASYCCSFTRIFSSIFILFDTLFVSIPVAKNK